MSSPSYASVAAHNAPPEALQVCRFIDHQNYACANLVPSLIQTLVF